MKTNRDVIKAALKKPDVEIRYQPGIAFIKPNKDTNAVLIISDNDTPLSPGARAEVIRWLMKYGFLILLPIIIACSIISFLPPMI